MQQFIDFHKTKFINFELTKDTPNILLTLWASYGVSFASILENIYHII